MAKPIHLEVETPERTIIIPAFRLKAVRAITDVYDGFNRTCVVMIDRSDWFGNSWEALADSNFQCLLRKHPELAGQEDRFATPFTFAFNYAQRVFLFSAIELCQEASDQVLGQVDISRSECSVGTASRTPGFLKS